MKSLYAYSLTLTTFVLLFIACKKDTEDEPNKNTPPDHSTSVDEYLSGLEPVPTTTPIITPQQQGETQTSYDPSSSLFCTAKKYKIGPQYNEGFVLSPSNDVIFPGAILDGNSIYTGAYRLLSLKRTGGTISSDIASGVNVTQEIDETIKSQAQQAVADLLNEQLNGGSAGAQINFEVIDVFSKKQLDVALGYSIGAGKKLELETNFNFNSTETNSRVLVKFQQIYYTITYDSKTKPSEYFGPEVQATDVYQALDGTKFSPVYVSNIKYGRFAYYSITSDMSQEDLKASLEMQLHLGATNQDLDFETEQKLIDAKTKVSGTIIGGNGGDAVGAVTGLDKFFEYIQEGGEFSEQSPGLPIAYTLRRLSDNGIFKVQNISEYIIRECVDITGEIRLNSMKHTHGWDDDRLTGNISMSIGYDGDDATFFPNTLWNETARFNLPQNGTAVNVKRHADIELLYNPLLFNKAFINIIVDLRNARDYWDMGPRNANFTITAKKQETYKIYLKDIVNTVGLQDPWRSPNGKDFLLKVELPRYDGYQNYCTKVRRNTCKEWCDCYHERPLSDIELAFSMSVVEPKID